MRTDVVVGCDAIDVGPDFVRLREPGGSLRTIPWASIGSAARLHNDENMTFEGELSPMTTLRATHDPLWIQTAEGVDFVMLEKSNPRTELIIETVRGRMGARWVGDNLSAMDAAMRMFKGPKITTGGGIPKVMIIALAGMILIFAIAIVIAMVGRNAQ